MPEYFQGASPILLLEWWKPVKGFKNLYEVSCKGTVRRVGSSKPLKLHLSVYGYPSVNLASRGARCVHTIVAAAFHGKRPSGKVTDHINGDKRNPSVSNLEYITQGENVRRAGKLGLTARGERLPQAKLTEEQVRAIQKVKRQVNPKLLAEEYGISYWNVYNIWSRRTWSHVR